MAKGRPKKVKSVSVPTEAVEEKPVEKTEEVITETSPVLPELPEGSNTTSEIFVEEKKEETVPVIEEIVEEKPVEKAEKPDMTSDATDLPKIDNVSDFIQKEEKKPTKDENKLSMMIAQLKTMPMYKYLAKSSLIRIAIKKIEQQKAKTL